MRKSKIETALFYLLVLIIILFCVFPFYYMIVTSFKSGQGLYRVDYIPFLGKEGGWTFANYTSGLEGPFVRSFFNSIIISTITVTFSLFLSVTAAYALGRIKFKGRGKILLAILAVSMFPQVAVLTGMFELVRALGLYGKLGSMILAYTMFSLPFTVWILTTFIRDFPMELEEAAIMDGASPPRIIWSIFLPIMWPAMVTTGLLAFIAAWNEFLFALTFTATNPESKTVTVAIAQFSSSSATDFSLPWGSIMAASVIVTLPLILLVLIFQRKIVAGLTGGAVKG
ncbi:MAG: carbohydrate ABC transporter permease [Alphaproteobacteria bacterium]